MGLYPASPVVVFGDKCISNKTNLKSFLTRFNRREMSRKHQC